MSDDINYEKLVAEIVTDRLDSIVAFTQNAAFKVTNALRGRIRRTFKGYIETLQRKYSTSKTLIYRETPHALTDFYEPLDLGNEDMILTSPGVSDLCALQRPILITGSGGCGKSTLLKALLLEVIREGVYLPVFVELRYLESSGDTLIDYITHSMRLHTLKLPPDFIKAAIQRGGFSLFLDGIDELSQENLTRITEEIQLVAEVQPKNLILVASRPGEDFVSWANFVELKVQPLSLQKACNLIKRLKVEEGLKKRFTRDLRKELYQRHSTFFANPLLLSIMLLTYQDSASIPGQLHNFYSLAFDALYFRHDASKAGFRRPTRTQLPIDRGRTLMSAFSIMTYLEEKTVFPEAEVLEYLVQSTNLAGIKVDCRDLLKDLITAFCMLVKEGTLYTFTHRSFQEYFSALFFVSAPEEQQAELIEKFVPRLDQDQTLDLAHGMNPLLVERLLIIPYLEELRSKAKLTTTPSRASFFRYLHLHYQALSMSEPKSFGYLNVVSADNWKRLRNSKLAHFVLRRFSNEFESQRVPTMASSEEKAALTAFLKSRGEEKGIAFSILERKRTIAKAFYQTSMFAHYPSEFMKLLQSLHERHRAQASSFQSLMRNASIKDWLH